MKRSRYQQGGWVEERRDADDWLTSRRDWILGWLGGMSTKAVEVEGGRGREASWGEIELSTDLKVLFLASQSPASSSFLLLIGASALPGPNSGYMANKSVFVSFIITSRVLRTIRRLRLACDHHSSIRRSLQLMRDVLPRRKRKIELLVCALCVYLFWWSHIRARGDFLRIFLSALSEDSN